MGIKLGEEVVSALSTVAVEMTVPSLGGWFCT